MKDALHSRLCLVLIRGLPSEVVPPVSAALRSDCSADGSPSVESISSCNGMMMSESRGVLDSNGDAAGIRPPSLNRA